MTQRQELIQQVSELLTRVEASTTEAEVLELTRTVWRDHVQGLSAWLAEQGRRRRAH